MDDALTGATGSSAEPTAAGTAPADRRLDLAPEADGNGTSTSDADVDVDADAAVAGDGDGEATSTRKRRRGSRGGQRRKKPAAAAGGESIEGDTAADEAPGLVAPLPPTGIPSCRSRCARAAPSPRQPSGRSCASRRSVTPVRPR